MVPYQETVNSEVVTFNKSLVKIFSHDLTEISGQFDKFAERKLLNGHGGERETFEK